MMTQMSDSLVTQMGGILHRDQWVKHKTSELMTQMGNLAYITTTPTEYRLHYTIG